MVIAHAPAGVDALVGPLAGQELLRLEIRGGEIGRAPAGLELHVLRMGSVHPRG